MRITLDHQEIDQALIDYVRKQGLQVNPGDIDIHVENGKISAAISTSFLTGAAVATQSTPVAVEPATQETPAVGATEPNSAPEEQDVDRDQIKIELDKRSIEYAPKARTATLVALLEEAQANDKQPAPEADTGNIFGGATDPDATEPDDTPPFGMDDTPAEEPAPKQPVTEEPDDDKPLFGN